MNAKRILLLAIAAVIVWYAFLRKKALPTMVVVNTPASPTNALRNAATQTVNTAAVAVQPAIANLAGTLANGIATSLGSYGQGGVSGADTGSLSSYGDFVDLNPSGDYSGTGSEF